MEWKRVLSKQQSKRPLAPISIPIMIQFTGALGLENEEYARSAL